MQSSPPLPARRSAWSRLEIVAPALAVSVLLLLIGMGWVMHPLVLLVLGPLLLVACAFVLRTSPILLYWLVPASMVLDFKRAVQAYDILVLLLASATLLAAYSKTRLADVRLQPIEWRALLLMAIFFTAFLGPVDATRFQHALKLYSMGFLAFETARWAVPRLGRAGLAWGPAIFCGITSLELFGRLRASGIPSFKSVVLRTYITDLSWGSSNYVAAALVVCLPVLMFLLRSLPRGSTRRWLVTAVVAGTLGSLLITSSRGGFVLAAGYFLLEGVRVRRAGWIGIAGAIAAVLVLALSPLGQGLVARFTNEQSSASVLARIAIWANAFERGMEHLPFGVGAGQGILQQDRLALIDPHNFMLTLFSETGPLGLMAWLWILAALWSAARRLRKQPSTRLAGNSLRATFLVAILNSLFEPTFPGYLYVVLFWWIAGSLHGVGPPADLPHRAARAATASEMVPARP
jgi:hypothetical protein